MQELKTIKRRVWYAWEVKRCGNGKRALVIRIR